MTTERPELKKGPAKRFDTLYRFPDSQARPAQAQMAATVRRAQLLLLKRS